MSVVESLAGGGELHGFAAELYPICRSITGEGLRATLRAISRLLPLQIHEVPTGSCVLDWTVPKEWNIRDAYVKREDGLRVIDFRKSNLHVVNYSSPIHKTLTWAELRPHLHSLPSQPDVIPYRTSYYKDEWGFCLSDNDLAALGEGEYEVCIDSTLEDGSLSYGEFFLPGESAEEVLVSAHVCHPSLANDNLSGIAVAAFLGRWLTSRRRRYSYRILFAPGTIGAITWLARNRETASRIRSGLVLTCVGDAGAFHFKRSRRGNSEIDRAAATVLAGCGEPYEIEEFSPYGYDERQYCSPGFNLAVGCLMRSRWGTFPEYHTSADNLDFIRPECLERSLRVCTEIIEILEDSRYYRNQCPYGEPQLGRRGLYGEAGGIDTLARLWVLNLSDGTHSLLDIAERSRLPFPAIRDAAAVLADHGLLATSDGKVTNA